MGKISGTDGSTLVIGAGATEMGRQDNGELHGCEKQARELHCDVSEKF